MLLLLCTRETGGPVYLLKLPEMSSEVLTVRRPILILAQAMAASSANLTWFMDRLEWFQALLDVIICPTSCHLALPLSRRSSTPVPLFGVIHERPIFLPVIGVRENHRYTQKYVTCCNAATKRGLQFENPLHFEKRQTAIATGESPCEHRARPFLPRES
jgi:hypothetical protein